MKHLGFRVIGRAAAGHQVEDNFELKDAARQCAQLLDEHGATEVRCCEVIENPPTLWHRTETIELRDIDWRAHAVGGVA